MSRSIPLPFSPARTARPTRRAALAAGLLLSLTACTGPGDDEAGTTAPPQDEPVGDDLTLADPWVKAAEEGMTSSFGTLRNDSGRDLVLIGVSTPASSMVELHETSSDGSGGMSMAEKEGGFPLPAGGELVLEPGGDHIMLMDLAAPLLPGDEVDLTLLFEDGTEHAYTATVKDFAGAQEHYEPEDGTGSGASDGGGHEGHDHSDHGGEE